METVYKSGGANNNYLITLEINPNDSNLSRDVYNHLTAKYRCRMAFVKSIEHKETGVPIDSIKSNYSPSFIYYVGKEVEEPYYDDVLDNVCTSGIHFFKTKEQALFWGWTPENGIYKEWYDNGKLWKKCEYKDGKLEGPYKAWYENGIGIECEYKNGKREGLHKAWHENGKLWVECEYKNGEREGSYKIWYENGKLYEECIYKNGNREGPYKEWYENGRLKEECIYKNGKLEGPYKEWYENGKLCEECEYKNGKQDGPYKKWCIDGQLWVEREYKNGNQL